MKRFFFNQISHIKEYGPKEFFRKFFKLIFLLFYFPVIMISFIPVIIIRILKPFIIFRFSHIRSHRMGHFAGSVELYCCEKKLKVNQPKKKCVDILFFNKQICN